MARVWPESACIIALLFVGAGELAAHEAWSPSGIAADDAQKSQVPLTRTFDGDFERASTQFRLGRFTEAERQFAWIAQVRQGTTWGERAQYYLAECQYQQAKYVATLESFERLHRDYPATEYLDKLVSREYEIARIWLAQSDARIPAGRKLSWLARLDGRLPLLDIRGSALRALEHVQRNRPDGPLSDDAAIRIADSHMERHDYRTAALYYDHFLGSYFKSPFRSHARLSAIEARILAYLDSVRSSRSS